MAGRYAIANYPAIALSAATAKTVLQLVPGTNHSIRPVEISVEFAGTSNTEAPVLVELIRQTTAGTMSAVTLVAGDELLEGNYTFDTSALHTATAEPTTGSAIKQWLVHPQGMLVLPVTDITPLLFTGRTGLRLTAPSAVTTRGYIHFEE